MKRFMLSLATVAISAPAFAQDRDDSKRTAAEFENEIIREIERGYFLKSNIGTTQFVGGYAALMRPVMVLSLSVGGDFIDRERMSASWEVMLQQGLFNGPRLDELAAVGPATQGDAHTFNGLVFVEASGYLSRRFGVGIRGGGGISYIPLLMEETAYNEDVVSSWGGNLALIHQSPLPAFGGGPPIEYYPQLSHFSLGAAIDAMYILGLDLGVSGSGYLKYTF